MGVKQHNWHSATIPGAGEAAGVAGGFFGLMISTECGARIARVLPIIFCMEYSTGRISLLMLRD